MSFAVQVNESTAASSSGAPTDTGKLLITGVVAGGNTQAAQAIHSIDEFTGIYSGRSAAGAAPLFDAVDGYLSEAGDGAVAYVGGYLATGHYTDGLALLADRRYGPGQLSLCGTAPSAQVASDVIAHCNAYNRVGLLDVNNGDSVAQMIVDAGYMPANTDVAALFGSWCQIPGPVGVIGAGPRTIPASAIIAALCKRVDDDGNPNRAAGGYDYALNYVQGFVVDPKDSDRSTLLGLGVNLFTTDIGGELINAGFRTNIASSAYEQTPFWQFNAARARMWLKAQAQAIGAPFYMRSVDGQGKLAARLKSGIEVACRALWQRDGLYGATPDEAYRVSVNFSPTDAGLGVLNVSLRAKYTMHAEAITINLVSVPVTTAV